MFPLLPKGDQTKLLKFFWLKIFSICHRCQQHRWQTLSCEYLRIFTKNSKRSYWDTLGLGGNWFTKKTRSKKSHDTVPLMCAIAHGFFSSWRALLYLLFKMSNRKDKLFFFKFLNLSWIRKRNWISAVHLIFNNRRLWSSCYLCLQAEKSFDDDYSSIDNVETARSEEFDPSRNHFTKKV